MSILPRHAWPVAAVVVIIAAGGSVAVLTRSQTAGWHPGFGSNRVKLTVAGGCPHLHRFDTVANPQGGSPTRLVPLDPDSVTDEPLGRSSASWRPSPGAVSPAVSGVGPYDEHSKAPALSGRALSRIRSDRVARGSLRVQVALTVSLAGHVRQDEPAPGDPHRRWRRQGVRQVVVSLEGAGRPSDAQPARRSTQVACSCSAGRSLDARSQPAGPRSDAPTSVASSRAR
jgi:hypothetical protein